MPVRCWNCAHTPACRQHHWFILGSWPTYNFASFISVFGRSTLGFLSCNFCNTLPHLSRTALYAKKRLHFYLLEIAKPNNLRRVHIYKEQIDEASKLAKQRNVPKADALHAILARDNNAQLISRDWDFEKLKDISRVKLPEDFI